MYDAKGEISVDGAINSLPQLREPQVSVSSARKLRSQKLRSPLGAEASVHNRDVRHEHDLNIKVPSVLTKIIVDAADVA